MKRILFYLLVAVTIIGCKSKQNSTTAKNTEIAELMSIMPGNYTSEKQSIADTSYFNISLRMVPIWKDRGNYLYVEQALFKKQEKPYRVRIYKVYQRGDDFISEVYTLKNEKDWIGQWKNPTAFDALFESDIELKSGCEVVLKRIAKNKFSGATGEKTCPSELRGARYAVSKVTITTDQIQSWDQGFDQNGKQVWGEVKSGYVFDKIK